ncbi:MAG: HD domain-containing protein [Lactobacillus sp.]|nr:HD domain-containing protein [Lactobacillus sp.]
MNLQAIIDFVQAQLKNETTGHDFYHGQRVAKLGVKLYLSDNPAAHADSRVCDIIRAGGYLHDTIDEKICPDPDQVLAQIKALLPQVGFTSLETQDILFSIQHLSFSQNIEHHYQLPLTGQYVQDADRLEALGAIGIARAFTYGGRHNNPIYDPKIKPVELVSHDQYRQHQETTINHFYEKLLKLPALMNTTGGKKLGNARADYMRGFLDEFKSEWNVD